MYTPGKQHGEQGTGQHIGIPNPPNPYAGTKPSVTTPGPNPPGMIVSSTNILFWLIIIINSSIHKHKKGSCIHIYWFILKFSNNSNYCVIMNISSRFQLPIFSKTLDRSSTFNNNLISYLTE